MAFGTAGWMAVTMLLALAAGARAAPPETVAEAWTTYVRATETRISRELTSSTGFLVEDFSSAGDDVRRRVRAGGIQLAQMATVDGRGAPVPVAGGMVHHWRGSVFLPRAALEDVLARVTNPRAEDLVQEDVVAGRVLEQSPGGLRLFLRLQRSQLVTVVYDTEHAVTFTHHSMMRASSRSEATRIVEIAAPGTPREREVPAGSDHGFLWRLNAYWRYEQVDGGVIVECESISLSRTVPALLRATIRPLINHVARESMERTLSAMRARFQQGDPS